MVGTFSRPRRLTSARVTLSLRCEREPTVTCMTRIGCAKTNSATKVAMEIDNPGPSLPHLEFPCAIQ